MIGRRRKDLSRTNNLAGIGPPETLRDHRLRAKPVSRFCRGKAKVATVFDDLLLTLQVLHCNPSVGMLAETRDM